MRRFAAYRDSGLKCGLKATGNSVISGFIRMPGVLRNGKIIRRDFPEFSLLAGSMLRASGAVFLFENRGAFVTG